MALLGRFLGGSASALGGSDDAVRASVKSWVAIYRECQTFAFLPYQLLFSITLVLFPMLARARAEGDEGAVRSYVARGSRLAAIFCGLLVGVVVAMPESMLAFAYGADAARGADVLRVMALGQAAFAMLGIGTTVLTSLGHERTSAIVTLGAVVGVAGACAGLVPEVQFGHAQLVRSAEATGGALFVALVVAAVIVRGRAGSFVPAATVARVALALGACVGVGLVMPRVGRMVTPLLALVVAGGYAAVLIVTGEIGRSDLAMVSALARKKR
jgi:stage V sporulation protein B